MKPLFIALLILAAQLPAAPIKVMLLDGESGGSYHKWELVTPVLKKQLEETGLFQVDVVTAPKSGTDFSGFKPGFSKYPVIVSNYDAPDWPAEIKAAFEQYMKDGGGLVTVHAADNSFGQWEQYNLMIGIGGWRGRTEASGPYWFYRGGKLVSDTSAGKAGSHGARIPYLIETREAAHPIMKGLPVKWMHQGDELYSAMRGPGKQMTVLSTSYSDPANRGTGRDEPILMTLAYGKGRVFHTVLGHDVNALACVGFMVTLQRGTEWAATGKVTQKVPGNFPTANSVTYRTDVAAMDPGYVKGLNPLDARPPAPGGKK